MKSIVVLISGSGTNLQKVIDTSHNKKLKINLVVSNRKKAYGLERAKDNNIPTLYFPFIKKKQDRIEYDKELGEKILKLVPDVDYIFCLGWMHILSEKFINMFEKNTIINLHPALPGQFPGKNAIEQAFKSFQSDSTINTGVMVHYVIPEVDAGAVIEKIIIPIYKFDTLEDLKYRVTSVEKVVLMRAVNKIIK